MAPPVKIKVAPPAQVKVAPPAEIEEAPPAQIKVTAQGQGKVPQRVKGIVTPRVSKFVAIEYSCPTINQFTGIGDRREQFGQEIGNKIYGKNGKIKIYFANRKGQLPFQ